jgi:hypothetical protein
LINEFREFQEGLAVLQNRVDSLASFLGTKVRYLEEEIHYLRSVLEGQRIEHAREDGFQGYGALGQAIREGLDPEGRHE